MTNQIGAAVDLGSTTIAVRCYDMVEHNVLGETSFANPQCRYGADVITRIQHCIREPAMAETLQKMVWDSLTQHIKEMLTDAMDALSVLVVSGNTTMQHLLRGLSVEGLAKTPFRAVDLKEAEEIISMNGHDVKVIYPPGFSAFVGADILTGAAYLQMGQSPQFDLLVDLGTNGELLLLNQDKGYASSTACGPVFDHVLSGAAYGSESIHAIAGCVKRKLINENGIIATPFFEKGIQIDKNFVIKQSNIRNFQLAKGAIYAGICCLVQEAGMNLTEIGNTYISGGLGFYMDVKDAFDVGLLPKELKGKTIISGNSSLEGAIRFLQEPQYMRERCAEVVKRTTCFELAQMPQFEKIFIKSLNF